MKSKKIILLLFVSILFISCNNKKDKFIGYWQMEGSKIESVMEIKKDGKLFYIIGGEKEFQANFDNTLKLLLPK